MTLFRKIQKAFQWQTYWPGRDGKARQGDKKKARGWSERRRYKRRVAREKALAFDHLMKRVDPAALAKVQALSARENTDDVFWTKYLDVDKWLTLNVRYAKELGMLDQPPRSVLDLGCGGGFFLVVCRALGARVLGLDLDKDVVLNEMIRLFGLQRCTWRIRAFVKLPDFKRRFDLITAFMICFNFPPRHPYWGPREWDFFINDMADRLYPAGRLLLSLNKQPDGKEYDDILRRYFEHREGVVTGKRIVFTKEGLERTRDLLVRQPELGVRGEIAVAA